MEEALTALAAFLAFGSVVFTGWCQLSRANRLQREVDRKNREIAHLRDRVAALDRQSADTQRQGRPYQPSSPRGSHYVQDGENGWRVG